MNMSFTLTVEQMRNRTKDVTRRFGWHDLKAGDVLMAIEKGQGLKKGEKVKQLYPIRIVSVRVEPLAHITMDDIRREGFPNMEHGEFLAMFCSLNNCNPFDEVNRIEFEEVVNSAQEALL